MGGRCDTIQISSALFFCVDPGARESREAGGAGRRGAPGGRSCLGGEKPANDVPCAHCADSGMRAAGI